MAKVEQYRPQSAAARSPVVTPAPNAGQAEGAIFHGLMRLSGALENRLDQQAEIEGEKAGGLAGLDRQFRPTGEATIRGMAYDRAGLRVAAGRLEVEQTAKADALARQHQGDPAGLAAAFDQAMNQAKTELGSGLEELWPQLQIGWERLKRAHLADAARQNEVAMRDADRATALDQIQARTRRIEQLAYSAGRDPAAAAAVQGEMAGLQDLLLEHGPREAFSFGGRQFAADPGRGGALRLEDIQKLLLNAHDTAMEARVMGKFALVDGWGAQQQFRDGVMADYKAGKLPLSLEQVERLGNKMDAQIAHNRAAADAAAAGLRETVRDSIEMLKKGFAPALDLNQLDAAARMSGRPDLVEGLNEARMLYDFQSKARTLPPAALDQFLSSERARMNKEGATPLAVARFELAENLRDNMTTGLKRDPLAWASQQGGRPLPPLDLGNAQSAAQSMRARVAYADAIASDYGVAPRYFTDDERRGLAAHLAAQDAPGRMQLLAAIAGGVSDARLPAVAGDLATQNPALAQAMQLLKDGNVWAASKINAGIDLLKQDKGAAGKAGLDKMRAAAQPLLSHLPSGLGAAKGAILDAATKIYANEMATKPDTEFDPQQFARALQIAAGAQYQGDDKLSGGFDRVNGNTIIVPAGMTGQDVESLLDRAKDADFAAAGVMGKGPVYGNGKPVSAMALRQAYPISVGPGLLAFSTTAPDAGPPHLIAAKDGRGYYVLDVRALRKRNPKGSPVVLGDIPAMGGL